MHNAHTPRPAARGFTMIEVLVVVAMLAAMMAIMGPRFRISDSIDVQLSGMQLAQDVELSRTRALATKSDVRFVVEVLGDSGAYTAYLDVDRDGTIAETHDESVALRGVGRRPLRPRVRFGLGNASPLPNDPAGQPVGFADGRLLFNSRGLTEPLGTAGVIYLESTVNPDRVSAVAISGSGGVRLWHWRDGEWR